MIIEQSIPTVYITAMPQPGQKGNHVKALQARLTEFGFAVGLIDGDFGPKTLAGTSAFQRSIGLAGSGTPGPKTIKGLRLEIKESDVPPWLLSARQDLGVCQIPGPAANSRITEFHATTTLKATSDEVAWCSSFVNYHMIKAGHRGTNSAAARSWMGWGVALNEPKLGAIFVEWRVQRNGWQGHVGFVDKGPAGQWVLLGGNQSNCVTHRAWNTSRLLGYRWIA
jgi:uncharacterized protein (TIGR02594 family)